MVKEYYTRFGSNYCKEADNIEADLASLRPATVSSVYMLWSRVCFDVAMDAWQEE